MEESLEIFFVNEHWFLCFWSIVRNVFLNNHRSQIGITKNDFIVVGYDQISVLGWSYIFQDAFKSKLDIVIDACFCLSIENSLSFQKPRSHRFFKIISEFFSVFVSNCSHPFVLLCFLGILIINTIKSHEVIRNFNVEICLNIILFLIELCSDGIARES